MCRNSEGEEKCEKLQLRKRREKNFPPFFSQARKTNTLVAYIEMDEEEARNREFFCFIVMTAQRDEKNKKLSLNEKNYETLKHREKNARETFSETFFGDHFCMPEQ